MVLPPKKSPALSSLITQSGPDIIQNQKHMTKFFKMQKSLTFFPFFFESVLLIFYISASVFLGIICELIVILNEKQQ